MSNPAQSARAAESQGQTMTRDPAHYPHAAESQDMSKTREERIAAFKRHIDQVQIERPDLGDPFDPEKKEAFASMFINNTADMREGLDPDTYKKMNDALGKMAPAKYHPEVVDAALAEAREYVVQAGNEHVIEIFDKTMGNKTTWETMRKFLLEKGDDLPVNACYRKEVDKKEEAEQQGDDNRV